MKDVQAPPKEDAYEAVRRVLAERQQAEQQQAAPVTPTREQYETTQALKKTRQWVTDSERKAAEDAQSAMRAKAEEAARRASDPVASMSDYAAGAQAAGQQAYDALGARVVSRGPRPFYRETKQYTDTMAPLVEEVPQLQQGIDDAQIYQQKVAADATARLAAEHAAANEALALSQKRQAEREGNQLARIQRSVELADNATEEFRKQESIDPNAGWANRPLWAKFLAVLGSAMIGFGGRGDPMAHINLVIDQGLQAEKSRLQTSKDRVDATQGKLQRDRSVYQDLLQQTQNEREADLLYKHARLEQARALMVAQLQDAGVEVLTESQKLTMNALDQEVASLKLQIGKTAAANTPYVTSVSRAINDPDQRAIAKAQAMAGIAAPGKAAEMNAVTLRGREEMDAKARAAAAAGPDAATRRVSAQQRQFIATSTRLRRAELAQLEDFQKKYKDEIPGFVWGIGWTRPKPGEINPFWGKKEEDAYLELQRAIMIRLRAESGAAIGVSEAANDAPFAGSRTGGLTEQKAREMADEILGAHNSEEALRADIERRIEEARGDISHMERTADPHVLEEYNQSKAAPFAPRASGDLPAPSETMDE